VARLAGGAAEILEAVIVRLELVVGDAPVLDRPLRIDEALAVALLEMRAIDEVGRLEAPGRAVPVRRRAAQARARHKTLPAPHRQRRLPRCVAKGHCLLDVVLGQRLAYSVAQLVVDRGRLEAGHRVAHRPAFEADDLESARRELLAEDGSGQADADRYHVDRLQTLRHGQRCRAGMAGFTCTCPWLSSARLVGARSSFRPGWSTRAEEEGWGAGKGGRCQ